jgi:hypothetical protein
VLVVDSSELRRAQLAALLEHPELRIVEARDASAARIAVMLDQPPLCFVHEETEPALVAALAGAATVVLVSERFAGPEGRAIAEAEVAARGAHAFLGLPADYRQVRRGAERVLGISYDWSSTFDDASALLAPPVVEAPPQGSPEPAPARTVSPLFELTPDPEDAPAVPAAAPAATPSAGPVPVAAAPAPVSAPAGGPPAFDASLAALDRTYESLEWANYYDVLAIERMSSAATIRKAFLTRAARWHPDGFAAAGDEHLRDRAYEVYKRMAEAYRVLADPKQRLAYDQMLNQGQLRYLPETRSVARPEDSIDPEARRFYAAAVKALASGDKRGARNSLRVALGIDPTNPLVQALMRQTVDAPKPTPAPPADAEYENPYAVTNDEEES